MSGYANTIADAIGTNDPETLRKVEESMRHDIFHSTLDWQTKRQLQKGAREAYGLVLIMQRQRTSVALPGDERIAELLKIDPRDVPALCTTTVPEDIQ